MQPFSVEELKACYMVSEFYFEICLLLDVYFVGTLTFEAIVKTYDIDEKRLEKALKIVVEENTEGDSLTSWRT